MDTGEKIPSAPDNYKYTSIYPDLGDITSRKQFLYYVVDNQMNKVTEYVSRKEKKIRKMNAAITVLDIISTTSSAISVGSSTTAFATAITGVGVVVAIPIGILASISGLVGFTSVALVIKLNKLVSKNTDRLTLAYNAKSSMEQQIGIALTDSCIDSEEYKRVMATVNAFENRNKK